MSVLAWHFTDGMKYRDGTPLVVGQPCPHIENISICNRGYHASEDILHALKYAPGLYLSRTEHSGNIERQEDKLCSQDRTPLCTIDFTGVMIEFVKACVASAKTSEKQANAAHASSANASSAHAANASSAHAAHAANAHAAAANAAIAAIAANAAANAAIAAIAAANAANAAANAANAAADAARAANYAAAAADAARAATYAATAAADAEKMWQSVVLLQLVSNEYDRLCEAV